MDRSLDLARRYRVRMSESGGVLRTCKVCRGAVLLRVHHHSCGHHTHGTAQVSPLATQIARWTHK